MVSLPMNVPLVVAAKSYVRGRIVLETVNMSSRAFNAKLQSMNLHSTMQYMAWLGGIGGN
jgi:hypothetical protein